MSAAPTPRDPLLFKEDLDTLSAKLEVALAHRPLSPYTSKWNPIEHRLFCHVEHALQDVALDSPEIALSAVIRTRTDTGLWVKARILDHVYEIGRKCSDRFREIKDRFIREDAVLGHWKYLVDARGFIP